MAAGVYNFICEQGATFLRTLRIRDGEQNLMEFAGYSARMQVRRDIKSDDVLVELTTENGRIIFGEDPGVLTLYIPAEVTSEIPRPGVYDLELIDPSGDVTRTIKGKFDLDPEVTR